MPGVGAESTPRAEREAQHAPCSTLPERATGDGGDGGRKQEAAWESGERGGRDHSRPVGVPRTLGRWRAASWSGRRPTRRRAEDLQAARDVGETVDPEGGPRVSLATTGRRSSSSGARGRSRPGGGRGHHRTQRTYLSVAAAMTGERGRSTVRGCVVEVSDQDGATRGSCQGGRRSFGGGRAATSCSGVASATLARYYL